MLVSWSFDSLVLEVSVFFDLLLRFLAATMDLLLELLGVLSLDFLLTSSSGFLLVLESLDLLSSLDFWLDFVDTFFDLLVTPPLQIDGKI